MHHLIGVEMAKSQFLEDFSRLKVKDYEVILFCEAKKHALCHNKANDRVG